MKQLAVLVRRRTGEELELPVECTNNHGTRITQPVFDNLIAWRNAA